MIRPFNGYEDENEQFNGYESLLGYYYDIIEYDYYDGPLCYSFLTELGDIYVAIVGEYDEIHGSQYIFAQVTAEDLTAYHERKISFVELFDRGVREQGRYLNHYYGRYNEAREVVGEITEWRTDYDVKRETVFNHDFIKENPEAYLAHEWVGNGGEIDFVNEQLRIKNAITAACTQIKTVSAVEENAAKLVEQIDKLQSYITRYMTREVNVGEALGTPGNSMMNRIFTLAEQIRTELKSSTQHDETATRIVELNGQTVSITEHKAPELDIEDVTGAPLGKPKP